MNEVLKKIQANSYHNSQKLAFLGKDFKILC